MRGWNFETSLKKKVGQIEILVSIVMYVKSEASLNNLFVVFFEVTNVYKLFCF